MNKPSSATKREGCQSGNVEATHTIPKLSCHASLLYHRHHTTTTTFIMNNPNAPNQPNQNAHKYFQPHMAQNAKQLQFIRSCFAAIAGSAAGILGLTNWNGFLFYALSWTILASLLLLIKCQSQPGLYFINGWRELVVDGALNGLLSYILFHTFLYGLVHLYQW